MKFLVLVLFALASAASAAYLPAGVSPLNLAYSAAPVQAPGLSFYPYGALGLGQLLPYGGLHSYPYPYVPAVSSAPAAVAVSAAPAASASAAPTPVAEQKSLAPVAPAAPVVPEVQPVEAPKPVEETPEVKQARESFMALWLAAAKAAAESPDAGDAAAAPAAGGESAPSRRRRDATGVLRPAVRSWGSGGLWPSYPYYHSVPLSAASPHVQPAAYPFYY
ncbi:cuticle protein 16.5-like [Schistocerca gregaria]|uniref:cuticle protein 16.5-like n=1 Tax=Schistocerca gregaria TaxID=7010 RepID=UPI00211ED1BB|nr:cuticle protein 16.5-like [Schistocerca gregaria]